MTRKSCFTLAEVLITLVIIGVVAAMTIPTLISKMSQSAAKARQKTIEARLLDGINRYSTLEDGLSKSYGTTYDFLVGLSKHYKMAQICKANEITNCIPYDKIFYGDENESADVSSLTSIDSFMGEGKDDYLPPASFITAQGTPVIMAFKKDCVWDTGKAMRTIQDSGCVAYMYDESGTRLPNKLGKDWIQHGLTIVVDDLGGAIAKVNGVKIMESFAIPATGLTLRQCNSEKLKNYGISQCTDFPDRGDLWAYAMKYCHGKGYKLPNEEESILIARGLMKDSSGNNPTEATWDNNIYKLDSDLAHTLSLKNRNNVDTNPYNVNVKFWTSVQTSKNAARGLHFTDGYAEISENVTRNNQEYSAYGLCISD